VFCLCRIPKKVAKDNDKEVEKDLDFGPYDKDDSEEEEVDQNITPKAVTKTQKSAQKAAEKDDVATAQKEIDDFIAGMNPDQKGRILVAMGVVAAASAPAGARTKYDHETTMKNLINDTEEAVALMEKLKNDYESVYYMGLLCEYWKTLHKITDPVNRAKKNAHDAFIKYFKKYQDQYGLPPATPSTAGSKTSSRAASVTPVDESAEGEEMEEMEEIEEEEEEVEETK
jgi:hypothetical protein